jgi:hypothetical protein
MLANLSSAGEGAKQNSADLVVAALARLGHLASADGGKTVSLRAA